MGSQAPRQRDADRSRAAILDAAEALFAAHGFASVTMAQVGAAAGVSRGTPSYFFGSKDALYRTVLDRAVGEFRALGESLRRRGAGRGADTVVADTVDALLALVVARPSLVRLVDAHAAAGGGAPHADAVAEALSGLGTDGESAGLTVLAMCWFPVSHPDAARTLGADMESRDFTRRWRERVLTAVGTALAAPSSAPAPPADAPTAQAESPSRDVPPPTASDDEAPRPGKKKKKKKKKG